MTPQAMEQTFLRRLFDPTAGRFVAPVSAVFHLVEAPELTVKMVAPKDHAHA